MKLVNLSKFLNFESERCPCCGGELNLYIQFIGATLWKTERKENGNYTFKAFKFIAPFQGKILSLNKLEGDEYELSLDYDGGNATQEAFFFLLCDEKAIEAKYSYSVNPYSACYYRISTIITIPITKNTDELVCMKEGFIRDEIMAFKQYTDDKEKVYIFNLDYENDKTFLAHYSFTKEQEQQADFEPQIFKQDLPLLPTRPDFSLAARQKLIERFEGWIIIS